jgi:hypothetical protein
MKHFYPNLNDEEIEKKVKAIFFYARTWFIFKNYIASNSKNMLIK